MISTLWLSLNMKKAYLIFILVFTYSFTISACNFRSSGEIPTEPLTEVPILLTTTGDSQTIASEASIIPTPTKESSRPTLEDPTLILVYTSSGNVWLWKLNEKRQLTFSGDAYSPRISSDGQVVAFLRPVDAFHQEIWAINTDGSNLRKLVSTTDLDTVAGGFLEPNALGVIPYHFDWIPDTHTLAFNSQQVLNGPGLSLLDDLNLVDAENPKVIPLLLSGWGGEFVYSPDGNQIAITTPDSIILCKADGSNYQEVLTYEPVNTYSEYRYYANPIWSSDGTYLQVAIPPKDPLEIPVKSTMLWMIPANGSPPTKMGELTPVPFFEEPVKFSPDMSHLAYLKEAGLPAENRRELHISSSDSSGDFVYTTQALLHFLDWSFDSTRIAFITGEDQEAWTGTLESSPVQLSPESRGVVGLRWVDSRNFLYIQQKADGFNLLIGDSDGNSLLVDSIPVGKGVVSLFPVYDFSYP